MASYVDTLADEDLALVEYMLHDDMIRAIRDGKVKTSDVEKILRVDELIEKAPALTDDVVIYKKVSGLPELRDGGELVEPGYLFGTTTEPTAEAAGDQTQSDVITIIITVEVGEPAIELPGGLLLHRGRSMDVEPTDEPNVVQAVIIGAENAEAAEEEGEEEEEEGSFEEGEPEAEEPEAEEPEEPEAAANSVTVASNQLVTLMNECHESTSGRFCGGAGGGGKGPKEGKDEDGKYGPGYDSRGKPIAGTDQWLESHGVSKKVWNDRPYVRFEKDKNDPAILKEYGDDPENLAHFKRVSNQTSGYIMKRSPAPGSPYGKITGEARPDSRAVLNPGEQAKAKTALGREQARLTEVRKFTPRDLVKDRQERVQRAEEHRKWVESATPEKIRTEAKGRFDKADIALRRAKAGGNEATVKEAQTEFNRAKRGVLRADQKAKRWYPEKEKYDADTGVMQAQKRFDAAKANPQRALHFEVQSAENRVTRAERRYEKTSVKYTFAKGPHGSRLDVHPDAQNLKNLNGNGRVYWAMEGVIKADAVMTSAKKEDPKATVVSNPSVTLWQNKESTQWFAKKHLKGREVVLIPDADGVKNPDVVRQAKGLQSALQNAGAGRVIIASPPLTKRGGIGEIILPTGAKEDRKGVDDHLGAGKGSLGQLTFTHTTVPKIDLSEYTRSGGATGPKINRNAQESTEKALTAISGIAGSKGVAKIPKNMLGQASGLPETSALEATRRLERIGVIKVEHVFDPQAFSRRKRIQVMPDERISELVKNKVIKQPRTDQLYTDIDFDESPIITVTDRRFLASETKPQPLSSIDTWKPPKTYKGWTSPVTGAREPGRFTKVRRLPTQRGDRVVRTAEGAKRYGVPIGSPIPVAASIGSTVMMSNELLGNELLGNALSLVPVAENRFVRELPRESQMINDAMAANISILSLTEFRPSMMVPPSPSLLEFYNEVHDPASGRFGGAKGGTQKEKAAKEVDRKQNIADRAGIATVGNGLVHRPTAKGRAEPDAKTKKRLETPLKGDRVAHKAQTRKQGMSLGEKIAVGVIVGYGLLIVGSVVATTVYPAAARKLAAARLRNVPVLKTGKGFKLKAKNGQALHLIDETGKVSKRQAQGMLRSLQSIHDKKPLPGDPVRIVVRDPGIMDSSAAAYVRIGEKAKARTIYVNRESFDDAAVKFHWSVKGGHFMPSFKRNASRHLITHEYGHLWDNEAILKFKDADDLPGYQAYEARATGIANRFRRRGSGLSGYGRGVGATPGHERYEAYAESFAEWHTTDGRTSNPAARAYAKEFGW